MDVQSQPVALIASNITHFDFEAVFQAQYPKIARLIARVLNDSARAEELSVEVFWKLSRTPAAQGNNVNGWLHRTAVRKALDELRKQCRREKYEHLFSLSRTPAGENLQSVSDKQHQVRSILVALDRRSAEMLVLRSEGFNYQDIAQALGIGFSSVGTLLGPSTTSIPKGVHQALWTTSMNKMSNTGSMSRSAC